MPEARAARIAGPEAAEDLAARLARLTSFDYAPALDREAARRALDETGLPAPRSEAWKYTNVVRWYESALDPTPAVSPVPLNAPEGVELHDFASAGAARLLASGTAVDLDRHPLAAANRLLLGAGVTVRVPSGLRPTSALRLDDLGAAYEHVLVVLEPGAELTLIEEPRASRHRIVECAVGDDAALVHHRRQALAEVRQCALVAVTVGANASYSLWQSARGADLRRNDINISLDGENAEATVHGAWRLDGREHLDNQVSVDHVSPDCISRQTFRGVAAGRARAVLNGRIHIHPQAQGSDASLSTRNLLESAAAEVYAKPELEIYANDVRCSHGATVGALDEDALFYCKARGIPPASARSLLVHGFLREAVSDEEAWSILEGAA